MKDLTPPPLHGPSAKEKKYDRQLRLWAASGQAALENAHLLLVNTGPGVVGVEALKNLVLPGIGQYTILDHGTVEEVDLGVNFFLDEQSLGKSRAEQTCKFLQELNPDVKGNHSSLPLITFVTQPDVLKSFSHILVTAPVPTEVLSLLVSHAQRSEIPIFYLHCIGFYASFSIYLPPTFPIVDTHPDPLSTTDLRLVKPWPELSQFAAQKTEALEELSDHDHGHIPYLLLLLYYLEKWKTTHSGAVPSVYREKNDFRELVRSGMRTQIAEGGEENYEEAIAAVLKSLNEPTASSAVREVFTRPECANLTRDSANFWVIAHAIGIFYAKHGVLPLPGSVPDMKAQSSDYVALQNLYKAKARRDAEEVLSTVRDLERQLGREKSPIDAAEVDAFCKNAAHIKLVRGRPFHTAEPGKKLVWGERASWAANSLTDESSKLLLYIAFLAWDTFCATHPPEPQDAAASPSPPGAQQSQLAADTAKLCAIARKLIDDLLEEAGSALDGADYDGALESCGSFCAELCRAGGAELHNVAALAGGLVAQEVIKVVTKQYVPVDNTCLFDGVRSETAVVRV